MGKTVWIGLILALIGPRAGADYVEIGAGGTVLLSRPYCGNGGNERRYQVQVLAEELAEYSLLDKVQLLCGSPTYAMASFTITHSTSVLPRFAADANLCR